MTTAPDPTVELDALRELVVSAITASRGTNTRRTRADETAADAVVAALIRADAEQTAATEAAVDDMIAGSGLQSMSGAPDGGARMSIVPHVQVLAGIVDAFDWLLDAPESGPAINYVEQEFLDPTSGEVKARLTVTRPGRPSVHELRMEAERRLERVRGLVDVADRDESSWESVLGSIRGIVNAPTQ